MKQFIKHVAKHNTFYHVAAPLAQTLVAEYFFFPFTYSNFQVETITIIMISTRATRRRGYYLSSVLFLTMKSVEARPRWRVQEDRREHRHADDGGKRGMRFGKSALI